MNQPMYELGGKTAVAQAGVEARAAFITRTYSHLLGAILAFTLIEMVFFQTGIAATLFNAMVNSNWLLWLGGFMVVGFVASRFASKETSVAAQYAGLGLYVLAQAVIFAPLLYLANEYAPGAITSAAFVTIIGFSALTAIVFITRKDFSFMRSILMWLTVAAFLLIVAGVIFGFPARHGVHRGHDRPGGRLDPVRHLAGALQLPRAHARLGGPPALRLRRPHVLVRAPALPQPRMTA